MCVLDSGCWWYEPHGHVGVPTPGLCKWMDATAPVPFPRAPVCHAGEQAGRGRWRRGRLEQARPRRGRWLGTHPRAGAQTARPERQAGEHARVSAHRPPGAPHARVRVPAAAPPRSQRVPLPDWRRERAHALGATLSVRRSQPRVLPWHGRGARGPHRAGHPAGRLVPRRRRAVCVPAARHADARAPARLGPTTGLPVCLVPARGQGT